MSSPQSGLAEFVARPPDDVLAPEVVAAATPAIIDAIASILSGTTSELREALLGYADEFAAPGDVPVLGTTRRLAPDRAALMNATFGHAMDFDDTVSLMPGHPGAIMTSALISALPDRPVNGREFLRAFIIGYEVATKFGAAIGMGHYHRGWHSTGSIGVFGAFAAVAALRRLEREAIERGIGIVASVAAGLRANFGTMTKPLHSGWAASSGLVAAQLAESGFTGHVGVLDGRDGFFTAYGTEQSDPAALAPSLGRPFTLVSPGIALKKYPCCYALHRAIDALVGIRDELSFQTDEVDSITARVPTGTLKPLPYVRPTTGFEGRFSMPYILAVGGLDGDFGIDAFTDEAVMRPAVTALLDRVAAVEDPAMAPDDPDGLFRSAGTRGRVEVTLKLLGGRQVSRTVEVPPGAPLRPLSQQEVAEKYRSGAARAGIGDDEVEASLIAWQQILELEDVRPVVASLSVNEAVLL